MIEARLRHFEVKKLSHFSFNTKQCGRLDDVGTKNKSISSYCLNSSRPILKSIEVGHEEDSGSESESEVSKDENKQEVDDI